MSWFLFWLCLHVLAAVAGIGPVFALPAIDRLATAQPRYIPLAARVVHRLDVVYIQWIGGTMLVSGIGLIWSAGIDVFRTYYLIAAVVLYFVAYGVVGSVLVPATRRLVRSAEAHPEGWRDLASVPTEVRRSLARARLSIVMAGVLLLAVVFLMVIQPGGITYRG